MAKTEQNQNLTIRDSILGSALRQAVYLLPAAINSIPSISILPERTFSFRKQFFKALKEQTVIRFVRCLDIS